MWPNTIGDLLTILSSRKSHYCILAYTTSRAPNKLSVLDVETVTMAELIASLAATRDCQRAFSIPTSEYTYTETLYNRIIGSCSLLEKRARPPNSWLVTRHSAPLFSHTTPVTGLRSSCVTERNEEPIDSRSPSCYRLECIVSLLVANSGNQLKHAAKDMVSIWT
jgi:hypothetical protein